MCGFYHQDERDEAAGRGRLALVLATVAAAILVMVCCIAL